MNSDKQSLLEYIATPLVDARRPELDLDSLSEMVIGAAYKVSNILGCGFLEKVYENALVIELRKVGLAVTQQSPLQVHYNGELVGEYFADLIVEGVLIIEVKAISGLTDTHKSQLLNYLKGTAMRLGLLINFGQPRVEVRRVIRWQLSEFICVHLWTI